MPKNNNGTKLSAPVNLSWRRAIAGIGAMATAFGAVTFVPGEVTVATAAEKPADRWLGQQVIESQPAQPKDKHTVSGTVRLEGSQVGLGNGYQIGGHDEDQPLAGVKVYAQWVDGNLLSPIYSTTSDANGKYVLKLDSFQNGLNDTREFDANPHAGSNEKIKIWAQAPGDDYEYFWAYGQSYSPKGIVLDSGYGGVGWDQTYKYVNNADIYFVPKVKKSDYAALHKPQSQWTNNNDRRVDDGSGQLKGKVFWENGGGRIAELTWDDVVEYSRNYDKAIRGQKIVASYLTDAAIAKIMEHFEAVKAEQFPGVTGLRDSSWTVEYENKLQEWIKSQIKANPDWIAETVETTSGLDGDYVIQFSGLYGAFPNDCGKVPANKCDTVAQSPADGNWRQGLYGVSTDENSKHINWEWMNVSLAHEDSNGELEFGPVNGVGFVDPWLGGRWSGRSGYPFGSFYNSRHEQSKTGDWSAANYVSGDSGPATYWQKVDFGLTLANVHFSVVNYNTSDRPARPGVTVKTTATGLEPVGDESYAIKWTAVDSNGKKVAVDNECRDLQPSAEAVLPSCDIQVPADAADGTVYTATLYPISDAGTYEEDSLIALDSFVVTRSDYTKDLNPAYAPKLVGPKEPVTVSPSFTDKGGKETTPPEGTKYKVEDGFKVPEGYKVELDPDTGDITVTVDQKKLDKDTAEEVDVPVVITYPDNSTDKVKAHFDLDTDGDGTKDATDTDDDNDGASDDNEEKIGTNPKDPSDTPVDPNGDIDGDGIINKFDPDADGDGINNADEKAIGTSPTNPKTDGVNNDGKLDKDDDGIPNANESIVPRDPKTGKDKQVDDADGDGLGDTVETDVVPKPNGVNDLLEKFDPKGDIDGDGIINKFDPDADGDGVNNADEIAIGTNPLNPTSDGQSNDGKRDEDGDKLDNATESVVPRDPQTGKDAEVPDDNGDGLGDTVETDVVPKPNGINDLLEKFDPNGDADGDGIPNKFDPDADGDGVNNADEGAIGTNPLNPTSDGKINDGKRDEDGDKLDNATESVVPRDPKSGKNAEVPDNNGDGLGDTVETDVVPAPNGVNDLLEKFDPNGDIDGDGIANKLDPDADGDGVNNADEKAIGTNPLNPISDGSVNDGKRDEDRDGKDNAKESVVPTDPDTGKDLRVEDSDGDGLGDTVETDVAPKDGVNDLIDGKSQLPKACIPAIATSTVPLLLLLPIGLATQANIPALAPLQRLIGAQIESFNQQIEQANSGLQRQLGLYNGPGAAQAAQLNNALKDLTPYAAQIISGVALTAAGILAISWMIDSCTEEPLVGEGSTAAFEGSSLSSKVSADTDGNSSVDPEGSSLKKGATGTNN